jgi:hypothetical protein
MYHEENGEHKKCFSWSEKCEYLLLHALVVGQMSFFPHCFFQKKSFEAVTTMRR